MRCSDIQWTMERILYFRIVGKREYTTKYRVQVFRKEVLGQDIIYLQVCGYPSIDSVYLLKEEMQKAVARILAHGRKEEEIPQSSLVYEESFVRWLEAVQYERIWRKMWHAPMYADFRTKENLSRMLDTIPKESFPQKAWILGYGQEMQEWLPWIAGRLRSLTIYVEFVTKGLEALLEAVEEDFGLVTELQLVVPGELRRQRLRSEEPVLIIDYSGSEVLSVVAVSRGSVWLDMDSIEAKRHSMEDRRTGIVYISLKNLWKREMSQTLDTVGNFEYNTEVKIDRLGG